MKEPNCSKCPYQGSKQVPGEGYLTDGTKITIAEPKEKFDLVIVGMAPAREELLQGRPFIGESGQLLRKTLFQMGIKKYYCTNVLRCEIPRGEDPPRAAVTSCKERLIEEVKSKDPKLVMALGDLPLHTLTKTDYSIKEVEGRVIPSDINIPILPLTHPAYYLYKENYNDFFDFVECMRAGVRFLEGKYEQCVEPTFEVVTWENIGKVKEDLARYEELGVDLETTGFYPYGWTPNEVLEMGISGTYDHCYVVPKELIGEFKDLLENKKGVYWNGEFDGSFLKAHYGITPWIYFDGMLAHYTIDERPYSHGLKKVGTIYLGADNWGEEVQAWIPKRRVEEIDYSVIPTEARYSYLAKDVTRTLQLKKVLEPEVNKKLFWDMLMPACRMFLEIKHKGMRVDPVKIMAMDSTLGEQLEKLGDEIDEIAGEPVNPGSPKQVAEFLNRKYNLPTIRMEINDDGKEKMRYSTSKVILEPLKERFEVIDKILDFREMNKLKGTYIQGFAKFVSRQYRIHPSIKLFGSVTGRLSSENPSIMNIKSIGRLKEIFLPDDFFIYSDVKGNELRWYCLIGQDEDLAEVLRNEGDPHEEVRKAAFGLSMDEALKAHQRTMAKAGVFGRMYKRGRPDMERQFGKAVIDDVMEAVDGIFPNIKKYYKNIMNQVRDKGYLTSYFGRVRKFPVLTRNNYADVERQAVNFPIQSSGSDLMLLNFLNLWGKKEKYGIFPFWPVHDSITMDAESIDVMGDVKKEMEEFSFNLVDGKIPFIWEVDWGVDWALNKKEVPV